MDTPRGTDIPGQPHTAQSDCYEQVLAGTDRGCPGVRGVRVAAAACARGRAPGAVDAAGVPSVTRVLWRSGWRADGVAGRPFRRLAAGGVETAPTPDPQACVPDGLARSQTRDRFRGGVWQTARPSRGHRNARTPRTVPLTARRTLTAVPTPARRCPRQLPAQQAATLRKTSESCQ